MAASPMLARIPLAMLVATLLATFGLLVSASSASALTCTDASLFNMPPANAPLPGSCFEGYDGNQVDPDGTAPATRLDWQSGVGTSALVPAPDYVVGKNDSQFGPGGAEETPDSWTFNVGSIGSDKYDALAAWTFREPSATDLFLALAFVRASNNGETHLSFELNQKQPGYRSATETGTGGRTIKVPTRSTGDLLITYSVSNNDSPPRLGLCKWSGDEHSGHWQDFAGVNVGGECPALLSAVAQASLNKSDIAGAQNYLQPGTELDTGQFAEASINLTEALKAAGGNPNQPDPCVSFGYMWLHSRSSPSITSNQQDYILPTDAINVASCAVTGKKFHDVDGDGLPQEGNEPGLGGWTIFADYDNDGVLDSGEPYDVTAPANANDLRPVGSYTIANIKNGTWNIREAGQSGWSCTFPSPCAHQVAMTGRLVENINFGNNQPGKVRVVKSTTPDGDATDFDFDPSASLAAENFTLRDGQAAREYAVQAGTYSVTELAESGWDLDSIACSDGDSSGTGSTATFKVAAGETVTCTFTNVKRGKVRVVKSTQPDGDATAFDFDPSANLAADNFTRADNQAAKEFSVKPGTYSVTELAETGWDLAGIACSDGDSSGAGSTATFKVAAGETVTCTFTNLKRGTIEIEKQTDPDEPAQGSNSFTFASSLDPKSFDLADDGVMTIPDVKPNNGGAAYEITEQTEIGYRLSQIDCGNDADSGGSTETRKASIHVSPGETVRCTFTNTKLNPGTLVVKEGTLQAHHGDPLTFTFDVTNTGNSPLQDVRVTDDRCSPVSQTPTSKVDDDGDGLLELGEHWVFTCTYNAPAAHDAAEQDPIHNIATATAKDEQGQPVTDTDEHDTDLLHPAIAVDKTLRRGDSGDFVQGPIAVHVGDTIQYRFDVTNEGDTPLAVQFSDPRCDAGTLSGPTGDGDGDGKLDLAETWVYRCSHAVTAQSGDPVENTVTVTGTDSIGGPKGTDTDTDEADADVLHPDIEIDKQVDKQAAHVGDTLNYTFAVTNAGDAPLAVQFSDPRCDAGTLSGPTGDSDGDGKLDVAETWTYKCSHVVLDSDPNPLPNTAKVTGTDELGGKDTDEDSTSVTILKPGTLVVKEGNQFAYPGDTVTFTFAVTNNGNAPLTDVVVTDDRCAPVTRVSGDDVLDPGETWNYTCSKQIDPGHKIGDENPIRNVATATGKDELGKTVTSTDDHLVKVLHPAVDIEKTGPATARAGNALEYTLTVTNPGDVPFAAQDVVVTDPRCEAPPAGPDTGSDATPGQLDPGDTWTYWCIAQTAGLPAGTFVNVAHVTARDFNGREVRDTDEFPTLLEAQGVLPENVVSGRARLHGPSGCVQGPFTATVRGRRIARVTFYRDGKKIKTIDARRGQRVFRVRIKPGTAVGIHRVTARIRFRAAARTRARTLRLSYQRCRQQVVRPRFTG